MAYPPKRYLLTPRELEVLQLAAVGLTNEGTAMMLCTAKDTIRTHRQSILGSLHVHTLGHAIAIGVREGWIE